MRYDIDKLQKDFQNPPREYSPVAFWFWNGELQEEEIERQLKEMVDKGVYGGFMHARVALRTRYLSERWWQIVEYTVKKAHEIGFFAWIYDEYAWPSGAAGSVSRASHQPFSKVLEASIENWAQGLKYSQQRLSGPGKMRIKVRLGRDENLVAVLACKIESEKPIKIFQIQNLSEYINKEWVVSSGKWLIMSFYSYRIPDQVNYLNPKTIAYFIKVTHEEYGKRVGSYFGNTIPGIFFDEIFNSGKPLVWTDLFSQEFRSWKGYDLLSYLPLLVYDGHEKTTKVRCDYFDVLTDLYEESFFKQIGEWCAAHNLKLTGHTEEWIEYHSYRQGDYFRTMRHLQIPGADDHCFRYTLPRRTNPVESKVLSSISHLKGAERSMAEAMGGAGWTITPQKLKYGTNLLHILGCNMIVPHGFYYSADTSQAMDDFAGDWFYENPYWKYFKIYADYVSRLSFMLSGGKHLCDITLFYPIATIWANTTWNCSEPPPTRMSGEAASIQFPQPPEKDYHNWVKVKQVAGCYNNTLIHLMENQADVDVIDEGFLLQSQIEEGKIRIAEENYSVLILPRVKIIGREALEKIQKFCKSGGRVIAIGELPSGSKEKGSNDRFVDLKVREIFGKNSLEVKNFSEVDKIHSHFIGRGRAYFVKDDPDLVLETIRKCLEPDFQILAGDPKDLYYLHRSKEGFDLYFLVNGQEKSRSCTLSFRCQGIPSKWNPETGKITVLKDYRLEKGKTILSLDFTPDEGCFIIFQKDSQGRSLKFAEEKKPFAKRDTGLSVPLDGEWKFIIATEVLDHQWKTRVEDSVLKIPVMRFNWTRDGSASWQDPQIDDNKWESITPADVGETEGDCSRYLSEWQAKWITFRENAPIGRGDNSTRLFFRKLVKIKETIEKAKLCITASTNHKLFINGKVVGNGSEWQRPKTYDITPFLNKGNNLIAVEVERKEKTGADEDIITGYLWTTPEKIIGFLAEGFIVTNQGREIDLHTDNSWKVSLDTASGWDKVDYDDSLWSWAWERGRPPLKPWGNLPLYNRKMEFPVTLWYRQKLPIGVKSINFPEISGDWKLYLNGKPINFPKGEKRIEFSPLKKDNLVALKVRVNEFSEGLKKPIEVVCTQTFTDLVPWDELGLSWYSGRAIYEKTFFISKDCLGKKVTLEMAKVHHCAEIWINGKLAGVRIWAPYSLEITEYLKEGKNTISIVVANLLANRRRWEIFDSVRGRGWNRFWHEDSIEREKQQLISGLIGPVRLIVA